MKFLSEMGKKIRTWEADRQSKFSHLKKLVGDNSLDKDCILKLSMDDFNNENGINDHHVIYCAEEKDRLNIRWKLKSGETFHQQIAGTHKDKILELMRQGRNKILSSSAAFTKILSLCGYYHKEYKPCLLTNTIELEKDKLYFRWQENKEPTKETKETKEKEETHVTWNINFAIPILN